MKFLGRKDELNKLKKLIDEKNMNFSLIYGRRRVGKSELVKQVLKQSDEIKIYYECKDVSEKSNVASLSEIISSALNLPKLGFDTIEELLKFIFRQSQNKKIILVLDEYPYFKKTIKGIDSILQSLIDEYKDNSLLSLIILGSYVDVMREILSHSNPLYGRIDLIINLKQMNYYESQLFYPNFSLEDKIKLYSVFGGIPYYNSLIDNKKSVKDNIIDLIASPGARLENEISMYLNQEISKITNANEVFMALAKGYNKYSDILSQSHVSSGPTLIDILDKLIKMEIVVKINPINEENNKRKTGYYICDNLSLFYYRYIFKYYSQMQILEKNIFFSKFIEEDFNTKYVPHIFENICKEYLIMKNKKGEINPPFYKIGKYYFDNPKEKKNGEFDIVTYDEVGYVFYEVKFKNSPISKSMLECEINQVKQTGLNCYKYVFITKTPSVIDIKENIEIINLEDLFK